MLGAMSQQEEIKLSHQAASLLGHLQCWAVFCEDGWEDTVRNDGKYYVGVDQLLRYLQYNGIGPSLVTSNDRALGPVVRLLVWRVITSLRQSQLLSRCDFWLRR